MLNKLLVLFVRCCLWLRYRIKISGLDKIKKSRETGILFLPSHPALIDPIILVAQLWSKFRIRPLADKHEIDRFFIRWCAKRVNVLPLDDLTKAGSDPRAVRKVISQCAEALRAGENIMLYPAGHLLRENSEQLGGNSAVATILKKIPDLQIVLCKTSGLWGSSFSWATGEKPSVTRALIRGIKGLLLSGIFFAPRRKVELEFCEPAELPRNGDRRELNRYLENFYNSPAPQNTYVPYHIFEAGKTRVLPEPHRGGLTGDPNLVPDSIKTQVISYLENQIGHDNFSIHSKLGNDLGLDSLSTLDLVTWLSGEFGFSADVDSLLTVGDVMLAACGQSQTGSEIKITPPAKSWFKNLKTPLELDNLFEMSLPEAFYHQAKRNPALPVVADANSGVKTYRDLMLAMLVLKNEIAKMPGETLGLMMPASVGATVMVLATQLTGKIPAMINWTLGKKNLQHCLEVTGVEKILTSRALVDKLTATGVEFGEIRKRFIYIEEVAGKISTGKKIAAKIKSYLCWSQIKHALANVQKTAVILFTSGSESLPKAVPLTHQNIIANVCDVKKIVSLESDDSLVGILPPFHSFGLTTGFALPLALGVRVCYYPNPTDGKAIAQMIDNYKTSYLVGTPTFLAGILRVATSQEVSPLKIVVSGAEKCTQRTYDLAKSRCPQTAILEGYGVTECAPLITCNTQDDPREGTIGKVVDSMQYRIVDPESHVPVERGQRGMLIVAGANVFDGYLNSDANPFIEIDGQKFYNTGDLVIESPDGHIAFAGRLKRFIKLGGEMISLPAIETVLLDQFSLESDEAPTLAVVATDDDEHPEIVMFATREITRAQANAAIKHAGLSGLSNIRRVEMIEEIPLLGTGKTDHRMLVKMLAV